MTAVIILHNVTIKDESNSKLHGDWDYDQTPQTQAKITTNGPHDSTFEQTFDTSVSKDRSSRFQLVVFDIDFQRA
ncbi:hypothetical protein PGT21_006977 [Puccinia graminis f. sp. tritici]|uniref:Uncharacterized protein n=1 Tax=Puccinia graminis f. sp. tritici TaxID=56615 RepID=A0A5B0P9J5_PUCGR|nr:hypothetical protein PGT21_006977 [Puccinia graminis f. sp. tritici]